MSPGMLSAQTPPAWHVEAAVPATTLADSIGVNVHLSYPSYAAQAALFRAKLAESGIRHIRTGAFLADPETDIARIRAFDRDGIRSNLIVDIHTSDPVLKHYLNAAPAVESVEGPNEYDHSGDPEWVPHLRAFQQRLSASARAAHVPVIGPAVTSVEASQQLSDLSGVADYGNMHNYFAGYNPGTAGWGRLHHGARYGSLRYNLAAARINSAQHPILSTETGYCTLPATKNAVLPGIAARYIPRLYLEQWIQHVPRTYLYEFIDEGRAGCDGHLGLLTHTFGEKPGFAAVRSLMRDLGGSRMERQMPERLGFLLAGGSPSVHHLLVEKSGSALQLMVWNETPSWEPNNGTGRPIMIKPQMLHLALAPGWRVVAVRNFTDQGTIAGEQASSSERMSTFSVADRVTVIDIQSNKRRGSH
jgi:hypothetical protein